MDIQRTVPLACTMAIEMLSGLYHNFQFGMSGPTYIARAIMAERNPLRVSADNRLSPSLIVEKTHLLSITMHHLPTELVLPIMELDLTNKKSFAAYYVRLLQLRAVSPAWNAIALNTPSLWCRISNALPKPLVKLALSRSRTAPLHIVYDTGRWPRSGNPDDRFVPRIFKHAWRWTAVDFASDNKDDFVLFAKLNLPNLRDIRLASLRTDGVLLPFTLPYTPKLTHLCATGLDLRWSQETTQPGLKQLQLNRSNTSCRQVLDALANSPDLQFLELRLLSIVDVPSEEEIRPIHLTQLTTSNLVGSARILVQLLLPSIRVPEEGQFWISYISDGQDGNFSDSDLDTLKWTREQFSEFTTLTITLRPWRHWMMVTTINLSGQNRGIGRSDTDRSTTLQFSARPLQVVLDQVRRLCSPDEWEHMVCTVVLEDPIEGCNLDMQQLGNLLPAVDSVVVRASDMFSPLIAQLGPAVMKHDPQWIATLPKLRWFAVLNMDMVKLNAVCSVLRRRYKATEAYSWQCTDPLDCLSINGITADALESDAFDDLVRVLKPGCVRVAHRYCIMEDSVGEAYVQAASWLAEVKWVTMTVHD